METLIRPKYDALAPDEIFSPESDGKPMSETTAQARWMRLLFGNLDRLYKNDADVLIFTDLLWYTGAGQTRHCDCARCRRDVRTPELGAAFVPTVERGGRRAAGRV